MMLPHFQGRSFESPSEVHLISFFFALCFLVIPPQLAASAETPAPGSETRVSICDQLLDRYTQQFDSYIKSGKPIAFTDIHLKTEDGWACFLGRPEYRDRSLDPDQLPSVLALLKKTRRGDWRVVKVLFISDVPRRRELTGHRKVPGAIFPSYIK